MTSVRSAEGTRMVMEPYPESAGADAASLSPSTPSALPTSVLST